MEVFSSSPGQLILGILLTLASLGVILLRKPVHACLSFLLSLFLLALTYLELSAEFIAIMQILVYAGAILVIFMYVIILFQDAYLRIDETPSKCNPWWLTLSSIFFLVLLIFLGRKLIGTYSVNQLPEGFGSVQQIGQALYIDFFFPFEAVILLFLIAIVGSVYIAKKVEE